ncbi:hypothetical protein PLESTF_000363300 [Pleodorina starrii]|nr:hypothetical protein PLESTF_000363300 [Pleodorina starrii]
MGGPRAVAASGGRAKLLPPHATFRGGEIDEGVRCTVSSRRRGLVMACSAAATYRPTRSNPVRAPERQRGRSCPERPEPALKIFSEDRDPCQTNLRRPSTSWSQREEPISA